MKQDLKDNLLQALKDLWPDAAPEKILAAANNLSNNLPAWSTLDMPEVQTVKTTAVGSFVLCHGQETGRDTVSGKKEPSILLIKRSDGKLGATGGYTDLGGKDKAQEQPKEGAVRELGEEMLNDSGEPILDLEPRRLTLVSSGIDYQQSLPVSYSGHTAELNSLEFAKVKLHCERLDTDPAYKSAVRGHSEGEVSNADLVPISEIAKMEEKDFAYPHEFAAVKELATKLRTQHREALLG